MSTTDTPPPRTPVSVGSAVQAYLTAFGPYGFGVVSVLIIWFLIVRPELAARSIDLRQVAAITDTQRQTAAVLDTTVRRLEAVADRLERRPAP